jgi:hypothetical protein
VAAGLSVGVAAANAKHLERLIAVGSAGSGSLVLCRNRLQYHPARIEVRQPSAPVGAWHQPGKTAPSGGTTHRFPLRKNHWSCLHRSGHINQPTCGARHNYNATLRRMVPCGDWPGETLKNDLRHMRRIADGEPGKRVVPCAFNGTRIGTVRAILRAQILIRAREKPMSIPRPSDYRLASPYRSPRAPRYARSPPGQNHDALVP